jgi:hypothetical protein
MAAAMDSWLVMVGQLPSADPAARMRALRTLEAMGAGVLREGAYLLPDAPANRHALAALAEDIAAAAGSVHVLHVAASSGAQNEAFRRLFDRSARYDELVKIVESLRVGFGHSDPAAIARVLLKQRRDFEAIAALDFFPTPAKARAEQAIEAADQAIRQLYFSRAPTYVGPGEKLHGRTWATHRPLSADRLASAWLLRRFVDPEGRIACLEERAPMPPGAIGFGFDGAHFACSEGRVTYEQIVTQLQLAPNGALTRIGSIVHFLEAGGAPVPEAAGVHTVLQGALRRARDDGELLAEAEKTFDLLYEAYLEAPRERS